MPTHCSGKQGTHLRISGNGITPIDVITGGGAVSEQTTTTNSNDYAWWDVYTATTVNGSVVEAFRGNHGKYNWESFYIVKPTSSTNRLMKSSLPSGSSLRSWTSSTTSWVNRVIFTSGIAPITTHRTIVRNSAGIEVFNRTSTASQFTVTELECGCDASDCQIGTFPTDYCCSSCAQQSGILSSILGALNGVN